MIALAVAAVVGSLLGLSVGYASGVIRGRRARPTTPPWQPPAARSLATSQFLETSATTLLAAAVQAGAKSAIVALSTEQDGHSYYSVKVSGPCLDAEGLEQKIRPVLAQRWGYSTAAEYETLKAQAAAGNG